MWHLVMSLTFFLIYGFPFIFLSLWNVFVEETGWFVLERFLRSGIYGLYPHGVFNMFLRSPITPPNGSYMQKAVWVHG